MQTQLVTGGAGFIGSAYVLAARQKGITVINLDALTYSGNLENLAALNNDPKHVFVQGDIGNADLLAHLLKEYKPSAIVNFAAESHVDRSIHDPESFVRTNVLGTTSLLRASLAHWQQLPAKGKEAFRFLHVSTDEVFGALGPTDPPFTEETPYAPNSPYSASKASSDHMARAFYETYGLPMLITNCSNNYGPRQFPEKLIPLMFMNALAEKPLPIYGSGENIRDWLYVEDHCSAIACVLEKGTAGETYAIGGNCEKTNLEVVHALCAELDAVKPSKNGSYSRLITHVGDRLGHDFRYAINCNKIQKELGWTAQQNFSQGMKDTIAWYLANEQWVANVQSGAYKNWIASNYTNR